MKKFVFLYNADANESPADADMDLWMKWFGAIGESLLDMGNPLMEGMNVSSTGATKISPQMHPVSGYTIVKAEDMAAAIELAKGCPGKAGLQVYEAVEM